MSQSINEGIRKNIWDEKLTQELNYKYYVRYAETITLIDSIMKYALALTSISTLAFWSLIDPTGDTWKWLSGISSIIAVLNLTLQYTKKIESVNKLKSFHLKSWNDLEDLWLKIQALTISQNEVLATRKKVIDSLSEIEKENIFHVVNQKRVIKCENEIRNKYSIGGQIK